MAPKRKKDGGGTRSAAHQKDFKKLKAKVGKKAPQRANVTNTSFATKSIHLPSQRFHTDATGAAALASAASGGAGESSAAVTAAALSARNHSLQDLFGQVKHYNVNVRRDALLGLKDLLQRHPAVLPLECANLFQLVLPSLLDEERAVRGACLTLLGHVFPAMGSAASAPFQPLFVSFVCSGLSHMHYAVKRSALMALKLALEMVRAPSSGSGAGGSGVGVGVGSGLQLWTSSHRQILPNFLAALSERIFVSKQANIVSVDQQAMATAQARQQGGSANKNATPGAGAAGSPLANRAFMLQVMEQFLALCPLLTNRGDAGSDTTSSAVDGGATLHSAALHAVAHADYASASTSSSLDPFSASGSVDAASLVTGTRTVPGKYARKSLGQQQQQQVSLGDATSATSSSSSKSGQEHLSSTASFVFSMLPLLLEYWLESFGLASSSGSSTSASSGPSSASRQALKAREANELLQNLLALLKLLRSGLEILRANEGERRRARAVELGSGSSAVEDSKMSLSSLPLPSGFLGHVRTHLFQPFPFSGSSLLGSANNVANDAQQRAVQGINVEVVKVMAMFVTTDSSGGVSEPAPQQNRRKSGGGNSSSQADANELLAGKIMAYLAESFDSLTERAEAKKSGNKFGFGAAKEEDEQGDEEAEGNEDEDVADQDDDEQMKDEDASPSASEEDDDEDGEDDEEPEAPAPAPRTPVRASGGRKSLGKSPGASAAAQSTAGGGGAGSGEHAALGDLLPLVYTLLPRLPFDRQERLIEAFTAFALACHPLSQSKLLSLRLWARLLCSASTEDARRWWSSARTAQVLLNDGELLGLLGVLSAALANQVQVQAMRASMGEDHADDKDNVVDATANMNSPLLARYREMLHLVLHILLTAGRVHHGVVLDYNVVREQIVPFFGTQAHDKTAAEEGKVVQGPFWTLPFELQQQSLQLLYYLPLLNQELLRILLAVLCDRIVDPVSSEPSAAASLLSKGLVLDALEDKRLSFHGGLSAYISFVLSLLRHDQSSEDSAPPPFCAPKLWPVAVRMLRGISDDELAVALHSSAADDGLPTPTMLELLGPMLTESLQQVLAESPTAKLDLVTVLLLTETLLQRSPGAQLQTKLAQALPSALYCVLSTTLSSGMIDSVRTPPSWLLTQPASFLPAQPWLLAFCLLISTHHAGAGSVFTSLIQLLSDRVHEGGDNGHENSAVQAIVVLIALFKAHGLRTLMQLHRTPVLTLVAAIRAAPTIASATLHASLHAEATLLFGQQAA